MQAVGMLPMDVDCWYFVFKMYSLVVNTHMNLKKSLSRMEDESNMKIKPGISVFFQGIPKNIETQICHHKHLKLTSRCLDLPLASLQTSTHGAITQRKLGLSISSNRGAVCQNFVTVYTPWLYQHLKVTHLSFFLETFKSLQSLATAFHLGNCSLQSHLPNSNCFFPDTLRAPPPRFTSLEAHQVQTVMQCNAQRPPQPVSNDVPC